MHETLVTFFSAEIFIYSHTLLKRIMPQHVYKLQKKKLVSLSEIWSLLLSCLVGYIKRNVCLCVMSRSFHSMSFSFCREKVIFFILEKKVTKVKQESQRCNFYTLVRNWRRPLSKSNRTKIETTTQSEEKWLLLFSFHQAEKWIIITPTDRVSLNFYPKNILKRQKKGGGYTDIKNKETIHAREHAMG